MPALLGMLICGVILIGSVFDVITAGSRSPGLMTLTVLVISAVGCFGFFVRGIQMNTRRALAAKRDALGISAATRPVPAAFFHDAGRFARADAAELLAVPVAQRDAGWEPQFYEAMGAAALVPADQSQLTGPDGFPYATFMLKTDDAPVGGSLISLATTADVLTERGFGAVINPKSDGSTDSVFTCGDLLSLRLLGQLARTMAAGSPPSAAHEVLAASPSVALLPSYTRALLKDLMTKMGVSSPGVFLIVDAAARPRRFSTFHRLN